MQISVSNQAFIFLCSVLGGALMAFMFDLFRIKRKAIKTSTIFIYVEDILYWAITALIMFATVYYSNDGEIRGFIFIGVILGAIIYFLLLSRVVMGISMFILKIVYKAARIAWNILSYPFKILFKFLAVPSVFLFKLATKNVKKVNRIGKTRLSQVAIWKRVFKNARKKF